MKKIIGLMLIMMMLVTAFVGCSKPKDTLPGVVDETDVKVSEQVTANQNEVTGTIQKDFSEKMTLTMNVIDTDKQDKDARYEILKGKFNIDFDLISCSLNDVKEKVRIWVAGGDMPDMMWTDIDNASELKTWVDSGVLKELPDLSQYPNLYKLLDMTQTDDTLQVDGKNYFITTARDTSSINFLSNQAIIYRKDWAKALGIYKDSYTWEEMLALGKAMVEQDPGNNGAGKTIGLASVGWAYPHFSGIQQMSTNWGSFFVKDGKYVWGPEQPETIEGINMAKRMFDENIVWREQALAKTGDGPAKFAAGQAGMLYHNLNGNNVQNIIAGLQEVYPDQNILDLIGIMNVQSPDGTNFALEGTDTWGSMCFNSTIDDAKLDRILSMLDYLASEEGTMLQRYGVEGIDYKLENEKIEMLWQKDAKGNYVSPYEVNSDRILSLVQLNEYEKCFTVFFPENARTIMEELAMYLTGNNMTTQKVDYAYNAFSGDNKNKYDLAGDTRNKIIELIVTSSDIEKDYKEWIAEQQDKKEAILAELNQ